MASPDPLRWQSIPFRDEQAWADFMGEHAQIHRALFTQVVGVDQLPAYNAYPLADGAGREWLMANDQEHRNIAHSLGLPGTTDLASADLDDLASFEEWLLVHAQDHVRLADAAGLV